MSGTICTIQSCQRPARAKGLCNMHRQRIAIHGDPFACTPREARIKHGLTRQGQKWTPEYESWASMMTRCRNPRHKDYAIYGGRGVTVCGRWHAFENFLKDMGARPQGTSLDRFPNRDGNYEPGNCRWATPLEQGNNTRRNVVLEFQGRKQTLSQWSRETGINAGTLRDRVHRYKWSVERALTTPIEKRA